MSVSARDAATGSWMKTYTRTCVMSAADGISKGETMNDRALQVGDMVAVQMEDERWAVAGHIKSINGDRTVVRGNSIPETWGCSLKLLRRVDVDDDE